MPRSLRPEQAALSVRQIKIFTSERIVVITNRTCDSGVRCGRPGWHDFDAARGLVIAVGKKVLTVLVFPLLEKGAEFVAEKIAERWEATYRPYRLRTFTPDDYTSPDGRDLADPDWTVLGSGRALLFVHGTFSRAHTGFGRLPRAVMAELHERYGGRVFAFDRPTLASSPTDNARWLAKSLPSGLQLDADLITHSRGGGGVL